MLRMYIHCHAPSPVLGFPLGDSRTFQRIQAGAALNPPAGRGVLRDDSGENISAQNRAFQEFCAHYWVWKNVRDVSQVGFCSYRRYLFLSPAGPGFEHSAISAEATPARLAQLTGGEFAALASQMLGVADMVTVRPRHFPDSIAAQYCRSHRPDDWKVFLDVIRATLPRYRPSLEYFEVATSLRLLIFIAHWEIFAEFMDDLFQVLRACESRILLPSEPYQSRVLAFLGERFFNLFLFHQRICLIDAPLVLLEVKPPDARSGSGKIGVRRDERFSG